MDFGARIALDAGTKTTKIIDMEKELIISEPTLAAVKDVTSEALFGENAREILEELPGKYIAMYPVRRGIINDFDLFSAYIQYVIKKVRPGKLSLFPPKIYAAVHSEITDVQKEEIKSSIGSAAARDIRFIDAAIAAAKGAGEDPGSSHALTVLNLGAGVAEAAVVCMGRVVVSDKLGISGEMINEAIAAKIRKSFYISIGMGTAEKLKNEIGLTKKGGSTQVCAKNVMTGLPISANIDNNIIGEAIRECASAAAEEIKKMTVGLPNELYADIIKRGITVTGGEAELPGLKDFFQNALGMEMKISSEPELCVVRGLHLLNVSDRMINEEIFVRNAETVQ